MNADLKDSKIIGKCFICDAPILFENKRVRRTCKHSDAEDIKKRLGLL